MPWTGAVRPGSNARLKLATLLEEIAQHESRLPEERIDRAWLHSALAFSDL